MCSKFAIVRNDIFEVGFHHKQLFKHSLEHVCGMRYAVWFMLLGDSGIETMFTDYCLDKTRSKVTFTLC
jgi:hypothetical protein